jgi:hypothetical protein
MTRIANATTEGKASGSPLGKRRSNNVLDNMRQCVLAIAYCGAVAPEALAAHQAVAEDIPQAGLLAITSPDRVHRDWREARAHGETSVAERLLAACARAPRSSPSETFTRRRCRGSARLPATRSSRSGSTALASPATSPTSTAPTALTPTRSSTPPPAPASRHYPKPNERASPPQGDLMRIWPIATR